MSDTTFTNGVVLTDDDWFNDVNRLHYTIFGDPANLAAVRTTLAASDTAAGTLEIAVQSELETGTDVVRAVTPGRQHFHPSAAKGWVKFDTDATIRASRNVTSVVKDSTGLWTITWADDFSTAHYAVVVTAIGSVASYVPGTGTPSAGTVQVWCANGSTGSATDPSVGMMVVAYGDL